MAAGCVNFGLILGFIFLVIAAMITWLSLRVLAMLALDYKETSPTFYSVSENLLPKYKWVIDVALIINCFGGCIAYVQVIGKLMSEGLYGIIQWDKTAFSMDTTALIVQVGILGLLTPLCMMKQISGTKIANMIGLACIMYIVIMTFFYTPCSKASISMLKPGNALKAFGSFPTFIFAYACQQNMFNVANEIKDVNMKKLNAVAVSSVITGFIIYLPVMILPFLTYGVVKGNYLFNFVDTFPTEIPVLIGFILASLSVSISYVLLMQPVRCSVMSLIFGDRQPTGRIEATWRISLAAGLVAASFGMAYALGDNLGLPINIAGLFGGNTMCFIMPFLLYFTKYGVDKKNTFSICVMGTFVFCCLLYPICLTGIIYDAIKKA